MSTNRIITIFGRRYNKKTVLVKDLLYNIHRAFTITYPNSSELFIPISNIYFIREDTTNKSWIQFCVDERYADGNSLRYLPSGYSRTTKEGDKRTYIRKENS